MAAARWLKVALSIAGCVLFLSCSDDPPTTPTPTSTTTTIPAPPVLSRVVIEGNVALTATGQTTQLTATAQYTNGTSADVTSQSTWASAIPAVIAVSPTGLASAVALGNSSVSVRFQTRFASVTVIATPPGTVTVSGQVREPGQGGGVGLRPADVRVFEPGSGASMMTDDDGWFSLGGLTSVRVRFERGDLEPKEVELNANGFTDVPMQRVVRITAGETATPVPLAPEDLTYTMNGGEVCFPCRMIRVDVPAPGTLQLRLKWPAGNSLLGLWVNGVLYQASGSASPAEATISAGAGQSVVFVEALRIQGHVTFTLETSYLP